MPDIHASAQQQQPPSANSSEQPRKELSGEDKLVMLFSLLGLLGCVALYFLRVPSIIVSVFLSLAITSWVYKFLGGISSSTTFDIGSLKLGGSLAALVGVAFWINSTNQLDPQRRFHLVSEDALIGEWQWDVVGPSSSWDGQLTFVKANGKLTFSGKEYKWEKTAQGDKRTLFLEMTNGTASLINGTELTLESDVMDYQYGRKFHWKEVEPFTIKPAFLGRLRPQKTDDPNLEANPWGMMIYKKAENH
jgi:hypothetical protein